MNSRTKTALLLQLPVPNFRWPQVDANLPLAAGYLATWARERCPGWDVEVLPWDQADLLGDEALLALLRARRPDLVGFSAYGWNGERSLELARRVQAEGTPVVLGGPEVDPGNGWLRDGLGGLTAVPGEGEEAFARLLAAHPRLPDGFFAAPRPDLAALPSPYLRGVLPPHADGSVWLETLRGCPFACAYCTYGKRHRRVRRFPEPWLREHLAWAQRAGAGEVYLMDPSFNVRQEWEATLATLEASGGGLSFHTELVADALRPGDARRLAAAGLRSCEVGLQSVHPEVLAAAGRPWHRERWLRGVRELLDARVSVVVGLILGLPGDTPERFAQSLEFVLTQAPGAEVQVFPLALLPGSRLRERAAELRLEALPRPPYTVTRTPGYRPEDLAGAFELFEEVTGLEIDPVGPPALAGPWRGGARAPFLTGLRLDLGGPERGWEAWVDHAAPRAANHFVLWLRGWSECLPGQVRRFLSRLPHTALTVVLEDAAGWDPERLDLLRAAGTGDHYLDRDARPFAGPDCRVVPRVVALVELDAPLPHPRWTARVRSRADLVWALDGGPGWTSRVARLAEEGETLFVRGEIESDELEPLAAALGPDAVGLCFASAGAQAQWDRLLGLPPFRAPDHRETLP